MRLHANSNLGGTGKGPPGDGAKLFSSFLKLE